MTKNRTLRLPDELDAWLRVGAAKIGMSVHAYILEILEGERRNATVGPQVHPEQMISETPPPKGKTEIPEWEGGDMHILRFAATTDTEMNERPSPTATILDAQGPDARGGSCTCTPAERVKSGKHLRHCPARGEK